MLWFYYQIILAHTACQQAALSSSEEHIRILSTFRPHRFVFPYILLSILDAMMNRVYHPFGVFLYIFWKLSDVDRILVVPPHLTGQHQVLYPTLKGGLTKYIRKEYIFWWKTDENLNLIGFYETFGAAVRYCATYDILNRDWHHGSTFRSNSLVLLCQCNKKATLASLVLSDEWLCSAFL